MGRSMDQMKGCRLVVMLAVQLGEKSVQNLAELKVWPMAALWDYHLVAQTVQCWDYQLAGSWEPLMASQSADSMADWLVWAQALPLVLMMADQKALKMVASLVDS
jgi:hypothetical protein